MLYCEIIRQFEMHIMEIIKLYFFVNLGPTSPKKWNNNAAVSVGRDLIILGGRGVNTEEEDKQLYKFSCENRNCKWEKLPQRLKMQRSFLIATAIPNTFFVNC